MRIGLANHRDLRRRGRVMRLDSLSRRGHLDLRADHFRRSGRDVRRQAGARRRVLLSLVLAPSLRLKRPVSRLLLRLLAVRLRFAGGRPAAVRAVDRSDAVGDSAAVVLRLRLVLVRLRAALRFRAAQNLHAVRERDEAGDAAVLQAL